jgi:hypothetical protein
MLVLHCGNKLVFYVTCYSYVWRITALIYNWKYGRGSRFINTKINFCTKSVALLEIVTLELWVANPGVRQTVFCIENTTH